MRNGDYSSEEKFSQSLEALSKSENEKKRLFLPLLALFLSALLGFFSYFLYRPSGLGEMYRAASLIGEFLTEDGAISVFLGLDEQKEEAERRARIEALAKAYVERTEG